MMKAAPASIMLVYMCLCHENYFNWLAAWACRTTVKNTSRVLHTMAQHPAAFGRLATDVGRNLVSSTS